MSTAFTGAHLITGDGRDYDDATVKVEGDRIVEVETNGESVSADRYVDLSGKTLIPGLIDVHVHLIGGDKAIGFGDEATTFRMHDPVPKALLDGVEAARTTLQAGLHRRTRGCRARVPRRLPSRRSAEGPDRWSADARDRPGRLHDRRAWLVFQGGRGG